MRQYKRIRNGPLRDPVKANVQIDVLAAAYGEVREVRTPLPEAAYGALRHGGHLRYVERANGGQAGAQRAHRWRGKVAATGKAEGREARERAQVLQGPVVEVAAPHVELFKLRRLLAQETNLRRIK